MAGRTVEEVAEHLKALRIAAGDLVESVLEFGGELVVDQPREVLDEQPGDREGQPSGDQRGALLVDIVACRDGANDGRVGRRTPDLELFELGDQRRLGEPGRRLGLMTLGGGSRQIQALLGSQLRQLGVFALLVVGHVGVRLQEAREGDGAPRRGEDRAADLDCSHLGAGPQPLGEFGADLHRNALAARVGHLGCHGALPDQLIEFRPVTGELGLGGGAEGVAGRTDRLVRFLRVLHLGRVDARRCGHVVVTVERPGLLAGRVDRLLRQGHRVGTHIGDEARFVEFLGDPHGAVRGEAELAARLLLQGGGAERCRGATSERFGLHRVHREAGLLERFGEIGGALLVHHEGIGAELAGRVEIGAAGDSPVIEAGEAGVEEPRAGRRSGVEGGQQIPVGRRRESHPLPFAVDHQPRGDRLHASGRQLRHDLLPQHRGDLIAVETVEDAARFLGVHQIGVELAGVGDRGRDRLRGDLVEHHPLDRHLGFQFREQVPGDGFPLAVLVSCQIELVDILEQLLELADDRLLVGADDVERREIVLDIDAEPGPGLALELGGDFGRIGRQVADMAAAGLYDVAGSQKACEHGRLGRRLDDHQSAGFCGHVAVLQSSWFMRIQTVGKLPRRQWRVEIVVHNGLPDLRQHARA